MDKDFHFFLLLALIVTVSQVMADGYSSPTSNYSIYIYFDSRYPCNWFALDTAQTLLKYIRSVAELHGIDVHLVNKEGLIELLSGTPINTVLVSTHDSLPIEVWNGSESSLVIRWIRSGGIFVWTGDWEFYYYVLSNGSLVHVDGMENILFGRQVTVAADVVVEATSNGSIYIPSLTRFKSLRPFKKSLLNGLYYEAYGVYSDGVSEYIDPGLIRVGDGYFVKVGGTSESNLDAINRAVYIAEIILNRFIGLNKNLTRGLDYFNPYDTGIVYILPSKVASPYWESKYGDRIYFYIYENLSKYSQYIDSDFRTISGRYRFVIIVVPLFNSSLFRYNLGLLDRLADKFGLRIVYAIFPKWFYGDEWLYLYEGTEANRIVKSLMRYMCGLDSTMAAAIWFGWPEKLQDIYLIREFYYQLDRSLRQYYMVWIDGPYVPTLVQNGLPELVDELDIPVATELYTNLSIALYGCAFGRQIIVTGFWNAPDTDTWRRAIARKISYMLVHREEGFKPRRLAIWIYWDENDGHGELYRAYINGSLSNPLFTEPPRKVIMDRVIVYYLPNPYRPIYRYSIHFAWSSGDSASNIYIDINGTRYSTDWDGWILVGYAEKYLGVDGVWWNNYMLDRVVDSGIEIKVYTGNAGSELKYPEHPI